ncbi:DUF4123 domain-containing protein [Thermomonas sp. HDW16]|uniref:DUF4123 domain-containing protein n=1 Tax=Thermomonas sp. HDW16 TaxID=2714945 RepID=UPI00140C8057|nr:DUF4123 domain-containing protein [Thermomonas sp. HDW16]QIL20904.1 DUF4123 domain-containing protein [Thermomonas sp. HDW16]
MIRQEQFELLKRAIFGGNDLPVFAVLDGAVINGLPDLLEQHAPEAMCLFSGNLDPMLQAAAPYVLELVNNAGATQIALRDGWNEHWGIVVVADPGTDAYALRSHLRRILRVAGPDGSPMLFRFYDPRAFRSVVPTFDDEQRKAFFGPIRGCWIESRSADAALYIARDPSQQQRTLQLALAA